MNIEQVQSAEKMVCKIQGRLDTLTAPDLEEKINALPSEISNLVLDLEGLEYISSAGLRVLLTAQKKMVKVGKMTLVHVNDAINEVFEITGFADILHIE